MDGGPDGIVDGDARSPSRRVGAGFVAAYAFAYVGMWMALLTPSVLTLAIKVRRVALEDGAVFSLSLVLGAGAVVALMANPFFGRLSDRTASRFGMRRPWMVGGVAFGSLGLLVVALAPNVAVVLVGWCFAQLAFNALGAPLAAVLPDRVPVEQRGRVAGFLGVALSVGIVAGTFAAQAVSGSMLLMFMAPAAVCMVLVAVFVCVLDDRRLDPSRRPTPYTAREFFGSFWVDPVRHPDFGWAWASRFLLYMAVATLLTYQVFYLVENLGVGEERVPRLVFINAVVLNVGLAVFGISGGWLSDFAGGRRKVFIWISAAVCAIGTTIIAFAGSYDAFLLGVAISGVGIGVYLAVDLALVSQVLPNPDDSSKDLGVFAIAGTLPQSIAPAIAPVFLAIPLFAGGEGSNYTALFLAAAMFAVASAFAILPVKGVR